MGLRTASVGRPDAVIMAPALTDTVQTQNFNLPPKSHCHSSSPINSFETIEYLPTAATKKCSSPLNTDDLTTTLEPVNLFPKTIDRYLCGLNGASEKSLLNNMNSPVGDQEDKMGLQKTALNNKLKNNEVDHLFNTNLEANVEDIMQQVIKSIESNDHLNNSSDLTEVLDTINIDKELLEHVDNIINISMDDQTDDLEAAQRIKENQAGALLSDLQRRHCLLERRLDFLRRRSNKLTSKLLGQHISNEVVGVFEQVHRAIKKPKDTSESDPMEKVKPLTVTSAKSLARKIEMAKILQANTVARQKSIPKYFGSGSIETSLFRNSTSGQVNVPQWSDKDKQELKKVTDQLQTQLHLVQEQLDSEATESSSGAESCDELQPYHNPHQQYLTIQKRALWKYSTDRAAIASRWTWVQSQISDLEYRIRQHTELYKQVRATKGTVKLGDVVVRPRPVLTESEIVGHHDYGTPSLESTNSPVNGYLGQLPGASVGKTTEDECHHCARTRPLATFRKRRLLQVAGLHVVSKKAARPSTIRCNCVATHTPCALCTGRVDPTHPRDSPDTLGKSEKVALLDPSYHPVLSLPEETSQTIHLEAIMKMPEWQQRSLKMKTIKVLQKPERLETRAYEHRTKKLEHRKKYQRLKSSTVKALSEKIKKKLTGRKVGRPLGRPVKYKKRLNQLLQNNTETVAEDAEVEATISSGSREFGSASHTRSSSFESPGGSPLLQMQSISGFKQNHRASRVDSYDIDNIVIPYSVAASTRVEKLQYKEILTPKWRIAEEELYTKNETKNNGSVNVSVGDFMEDSDKEELAEEAVIARHDRCEHDEKKRFLSYMKFPLGRQRSHKRHDSLAESSGANTPDPASPRPEGGKSGVATADTGAATSLMGSPPPTPGMATDEPLPSIAMMRRRTVSQSRLREVKEEGPLVDYVEQPPYESRVFPIPVTEYDQMVKEMPESNREIKTNYRAQDIGIGEDCTKKSELQDSADSESTESAIGEDALMDDEDENLMEDEEEDEEDPNDPEWTDVEKTSHRDRHHRR